MKKVLLIASVMASTLLLTLGSSHAQMMACGGMGNQGSTTSQQGGHGMGHGVGPGAGGQIVHGSGSMGYGGVPNGTSGTEYDGTHHAVGLATGQGGSKESDHRNHSGSNW